MKFSVGDKIKLRKTGEEGEVVDIVQNQYLRVRINGVIIPTEEADLDFPYLDWFLKDRAQKKEEEKKRLKGKTVFIDNIKKDQSESSAESLFPVGMYLLFQPIYREHDGEDIINRFAIYLFSEWHHELDYLVNISIKGKSVFAFEGQLKFQQRQLLYSFSFEDASDNPVFNFEIKERNTAHTQLHFFSIKLARKKLISELSELEKNNLALFHWPIFTELATMIDKITLSNIGIQSNRLSPLGTSKAPLSAKSEIDLHIEKIEKNHEYLSNAEKLSIQIAYFQKYLDLAIADENVNPFRVIHGIGTGVLKKEIFSICRKNYFIQDFVYEKLNPGVTLIYFKS